jgi:membrane fusion protein (multidrug efflux system)
MSKKVIFGISLAAGLGLVLLILLGTKALQFGAMAEAGKNGGPWPEAVSTFIVEQQIWEQSLSAVGSIEPIQGIELEAEAPGIVKAINFENGESVEKDALLVQLDVQVERAQLRAAEAIARLAEVEYERAKTLRSSGSVTQSQLDRAIADQEKAIAEVENLKAVIDRKTIRAPFTGKVGIRQINLGQYVPQGATIVSLQANEKVFVNFTLPQQALARIKTGMTVELTSDVYQGKVFTGEITALSPQLDPITRTVEVQGTLDNQEGLLRAGLFVRVNVALPEQNEVLVVPSTAILYAPYGNSVFKVETAIDEAGNETGLVVKQHFVRIGERRGDFIAIKKGLEAGDQIVSAGAFKLRNNSSVMINNDLAPEPKLDPTPDNS